jgi:hypothetical protein
LGFVGVGRTFVDSSCARGLEQTVAQISLLLVWDKELVILIFLLRGSGLFTSDR